jgi:transcriptional regulator with XRE-family HTH domain
MKPTTLREARDRRRWTQDELAARSGIDQTTISNIECGRTSRPSFETVMRLASALGIAPARLRFSEPDAKSVAEPDDREGHIGSRGAA